VIVGGLAIIWGVILIFMRPQILDFSRAGGKGLRNRKILGALVIAAIVLLSAGGLAIILLRGL